MRPLWLLAPLLAACGQEQARREEAARVVNAIEALIAADRHQQASPLTHLAATSCTLPDVCATRQRCLDAFTPLVEISRLQAEARALLDRHDPQLAPEVSARLQRAEQLQVSAPPLQEPCLSATTALRQTYRL